MALPQQAAMLSAEMVVSASRAAKILRTTGLPDRRPDKCFFVHLCAGVGVGLPDCPSERRVASALPQALRQPQWDDARNRRDVPLPPPCSNRRPAP